MPIKKNDTLRILPYASQLIKLKMKYLGLTHKKLVQEAGNTSLGTLRDFINGARINIDVFKDFCRVLELDWREIYDPETSNPYYLKEKCREDNIFTDFQTQRFLDEIWVDPFGEGYLKVHLKKTPQENYLSLKFVRTRGGLNLTLRPKNDKPVNSSQFQFLKFKLRSPNGIKIGVRLRIVDAKCTHWIYSEDSFITYKNDLYHNCDSWSEYKKVKLESDYWNHFQYDGFPIKSSHELPDFSKIYLVNFEIGCEPENEMTGEYFGFIENKNEEELHLSSIFFE